MSEPSGDLKPNQTFVSFDSTNLNCSVRTSHEFSRSLGTQSHGMYHPAREVKAGEQIEPASSADKTAMNWEPAVMLRNLSLLEQKIHQVKGILRSITSRKGQCSNQANELTEQQKLVTADLTCIVIQLISTAGALLPNVRNTLLSTYSNVGHLGSVMATPSSLVVNNNLQQDDIFPTEATKVSECAELIKGLNGYGGGGDKQEIFLNCSTGEGSESFLIEDHNLKDCDNVMDGANLTPGSYEVLQLEKEEILAPHTHFCSICGKGFKRDANLRMHMRGHGDEYKTPAALAKPTTEASSEPTPIRRYSCPFVGCKRNKEHKKFQPLKTILCMKNHYKRSHCNKSYTCSRCNSKKFSVMADLKTHEKHCGQERWLCSCGTYFSRKDKLFGHVALFHGHSPALSVDDFKASGTSDQAKGDGLMNEMARNMGYNFGGSTSTNVGILDIKCVDDGCDDFLNMDFNSCNFDGFDEFPHPAFEVTDNPFFLPRESCNSIHRNGEN